MYFNSGVFGARTEMLVFAAICERMNLAVSMFGTIGRRKNKRVIWAWIAVSNLGATARNPHVVFTSHALKKLRRLATLWLSDVCLINHKTCREHLSENHELCTNRSGVGNENF